MKKRVRDKRGSVPLLVTGMVPVIMFTGVFAVEATRTWLLESRLQAALDAGALLAASDINNPNRDANVKALVVANYNENLKGGPLLSANDVQVDASSGDKVAVTASAESTSLLKSLSIPGRDNPVTANRRFVRAATANITVTGMELALVFDITLSMVQKETSTSPTRIQAARDAALTMLQTLYADDPAKPTQKKKWSENLYISVVPFNVTVNYGSENTHFLDAVPPTYPASWNGTTPTWGGCAEMRATSLNDNNTVSASDGLRRFYWASTYNVAEKYDSNKTNTLSSQPFCRSEAAYAVSGSGNPVEANKACMGHNDWTAPSYLLTSKQNKFLIAFSGNSFVTAAGLNVWTTGHGPNMMCPPATHKVLPLTRDRATVEARINAMVNLPFSYGTNIAAGLQAGWFTLSPKWRAANGFTGWPSAEPPQDAADVRPALPSLPLDYYAAKSKKVMVLLTDGDDLWMNARDIQGDGNDLVRPESKRNEGFYGAYGKLGPDYTGDTRLQVTIPATASASNSDTVMAEASGKIDDAAEEWCSKIKAGIPSTSSDKIVIYTIGFGSNIGARATAVLTNCASVVDGKRLYYPAPTTASLAAIFTSIGNDLTKLRLSQ